MGHVRVFVKLAACALAIGIGFVGLGCAQERTASAGVAADTAEVAPALQPVADAPAGPAAVDGGIPETASLPTPAEDKANGPLAPLDASCAVDSDCEVKDVGNCCGRMPACVNRAAVPRSAAAVQRECERTGTSSICGFQELAGCRCEAGRCAGVPAGSDGGDVR